MAERSARGAGQMTAGPPATAPSPDVAARSAAESLRAGRDQAVDEARAMVRDMVDTQRRKAAETLGDMAGALHRTAKDMGGENKTMARYTDMAAERIDDVVRYLRQSNLNDMISEAEDFARRQPWWVIGGAVAAGFVAARMIKGPAAESETMPLAGPGMATPHPAPAIVAPELTPSAGEPS